LRRFGALDCGYDYLPAQLRVRDVTNTTITYIVASGCAFFGLMAFVLLLVVPAVTAYRRPVERVAAVILSFYVLAAFIGAGVVLGALIILEWPRLF
jgi:hypothetical protein